MAGGWNIDLTLKARHKVFLAAVGVFALVGILYASWQLWGLFIRLHTGC